MLRVLHGVMEAVNRPIWNLVLILWVTAEKSQNLPSVELVAVLP